MKTMILLRLTLVIVVNFGLYRHETVSLPTINGRYTRDIDSYLLTIPFKISNVGIFTSYKIPHYFQQDFHKRRRKRFDYDDDDLVNYAINLNGQVYHAEMWPNHALIAPNAVNEERTPATKVRERKIRKILSDKFCHYSGKLRGVPDSKLSLSTCDGLAGYVAIGSKRYFIEPLREHVPNESGQHLHVVYERYPEVDESEKNGQCGTSGNWEDAWKKRFFDKFTNEGVPKISSRGTTSAHRYLETLVVCDKKFLDFHKNTDYETYVLTVMNMVSDYYHDSSGGNQMDVVVVRIMYLEKEEEEIDLAINPNAEDTLASFCKWQQKINPKDLSNPNHHDIAVLLTRYDICADNMANCGLMGLAYVASACTPDENCAINEDGGLVLGIVVAHEMGHVMGCSHDKEGETSCAAQDKDESFFVMAPFVHMYTTRWSTCSRTFITQLFENDLGECLNDEPEVSLYRDNEMLPGTIYDADQQCNILFPGSTVCKINEDTFCEMLLCRTAPTSCMSNDEPPADGTKCGENMWCYRKKCVPIGSRPEAVNGGWGEWSAFSQCSRTCGGGVSLSSRDCDNPVPANRGRYCIGERKKVKTCNMQSCPVGTPSFREMQCREHNTQPFEGKLFQWRAYFKDDEPCVLYCVNNDNSFAKLEPRVKDGTSCKAGTKNMCISGVCRKVGCDGGVDSDAVEDTCGICNGDGTGCKVIEQVYQDPPGNGYVKVVTVPSGSRNLLFEELEPSVNSIAVSDTSDKNYFLNGGFKEQRDGDINFGDSEGVYSHPERMKETLMIHGPLTQDLVLWVVFYEPKNVGYRYKYSEESSSASSGYTPKYHWEEDDWGECSVKCGGGGFQSAKFTCVEDKAGRVSDSFCEGMEMPEAVTKACNEQPCKTKWKVGKWGVCHACKYKSGVRMRNVVCVQETPHAGAEDILVDDKECTGGRPGTRELCNSHKKCKGRRNTDGLADDLMEDVWRQMASDKLHVRNAAAAGWDAGDKTFVSKRQRHQFDKKLCDEGSAAEELKPKLNVGATVKDVIPKDEIKLIEVPLKQSHLSVDLSDEAFETMGDKLGDSIDTGNARIIKGEGAAKILKELQHRNRTNPRK